MVGIYKKENGFRGACQASLLAGMSMKKLCHFKYTLETKVITLSDNVPRV